MRQAVDAGGRSRRCSLAAGARVARPADVPTRCYELAPNVMERVASTETPQPVLAVVATRDAALADCRRDVRARRRPHRRSRQRRHDAPLGRGRRRRRASCSRRARSTCSTRRSCASCRRAVRACPVVDDVSLDDAVAALPAASFGTTSHHGDVVHRSGVPRRPRSPIVVGNEAHGLDDDAAVDEWITIPHAGRGREPQRRDGGDAARIRSRPSTRALAKLSRMCDAAISVPPGGARGCARRLADVSTPHRPGVPVPMSC